MPVIKLHTQLHRGERRYFLSFGNTRDLNPLIQRISGSRWSRTRCCWHLPYSRTTIQDLRKIIPPEWEIQESTDQPPPPERSLPVAKKFKEQSLPVPVARKSYYDNLSADNQKILGEYVEQLKLKAYSSNTIRTYQHEFAALMALIGSRRVDTLTADEVKRYILYCINVKQLSENTIHSRLNALKFYYEQMLKLDKIFVEIPRPKKRFILPKVLGEGEVGRLFRSLENKKHKAILFTAYSAGLRVSEVVSLRLSDIDPDRMQILVQHAKGKKDRYVMLSPVLLDILRNYLKSSRPRPKVFLFEGMEPGEPMSARTAQQAFIDARRRAGIKKMVSFHSLRHSFATHLLEKGVDIKYIKELLGHFSINTTNRYLHVKREDLIQIRSPLDELYQSGDWDF